MDWRETEYHECSEDWRHRDRLIWASLPVLVTISSVIIGIAYGGTEFGVSTPIRIIILFIGLCFSFLMFVSLIKHRYYRDGSAEKIREILSEAKKICYGIKYTDEELDDKTFCPRIYRQKNTCPLINISGSNTMLVIIFIIMMIFITMLIVEFFSNDFVQCLLECLTR